MDTFLQCGQLATVFQVHCSHLLSVTSLYKGRLNCRVGHSWLFVVRVGGGGGGGERGDRQSDLAIDNELYLLDEALLCF